VLSPFFVPLSGTCPRLSLIERFLLGPARATPINNLRPGQEGGAENPTPQHGAAIWQKEHGVMVKFDDLARDRCHAVIIND